MIDLLDSDDGLDEDVAKVRKVLGRTEYVELLDSAGGRLADAKEVRTFVEIAERDEMTAGKKGIKIANMLGGLVPSASTA